MKNGGTMKSIIAVIVITAALAIGALAQSADDVCQKTEYAELKDTPAPDLQRRYCQYEAWRKIEEGVFEKLLRRDIDKADYHRIQAAQCGEESTRILRALKVDTIDCEPIMQAIKVSNARFDFLAAYNKQTGKHADITKDGVLTMHSSVCSHELFESALKGGARDIFISMQVKTVIYTNDAELKFIYDVDKNVDVNVEVTPTK
jgi:hypothetical protein